MTHGRSSYWPLALFACGALTIAACSGSFPLGGKAFDSVAIDEISLEVIDEQGLADVLERHRGQVVLVDYWATWCPPCRKLFPHTVELHQRLAEQGLTVLSVSLDDPEDEAAVSKFLASKGATFENFVSQYGTGPQSVEAFNIRGGAVPYVELYDRDGTLKQSFSVEEGPVEPQQIEAAVEQLVEAS